MRVGFLYSGQGSQLEKMGLDFYDNYKVFRHSYDQLDKFFPLKNYSFKKDLRFISQTRISQALLVAFHIGLTDLLASYNIRPSHSLGLSLGELSSLYGLGGIAKEDLFKLAVYRGDLMSKIEGQIDSSMFAVFTSDLELLHSLCKKYSDKEDLVEISNINLREQIVISGSKKALAPLLEELKKRKIRSISLNTSGPFHTSYMDYAEEGIRNYLEDLELVDFEGIIYSNYKGDCMSKEEIKEAWSRQVSNTARLYPCLKKIAQADLDFYIELGHKGVLTKMLKRIDKNLKVYSIGTREDFENFLREVGKNE